MRFRRFEAMVGPLVAAVAAAVVSLPGFRGLNLWALWQLESVERFAAWRETPSPESMRAAFADDHGLLPLVGRMVSFAVEADEALAGLRFAAVVAAAIAVWVAYAWGRRAGGVLAGLGAAAALLATPRFLAAATVPGPTIFALATTSFAAYACVRARGTVAWGPAAWFGVVLAMMTSLVGWLLLLPVAYLTLVDGRRGGRPGMVTIRPVAWWMLLVPAVAPLLVIAAPPYLHDDVGDRLGDMLGTWLSRPAEPFLYAGRLFGPERIPLRLPPVVWAVTVPPAFGFLAGAAFLRAAPAFRWMFARIAGPVEDPGEGLRSAWVFATAGWLAVVGLRSPYHGGIDLLAVGLPPIAVVAGWGFSRAARSIAAMAGAGVVRQGVAVTCLASLVAIVSIADTRRVDGHFEAYFNSLIGGTGGAARAGMSRYPHGPAPPDLFARLGREGQTTPVALLSNAWELGPVVARYEQMGVIPGPVVVTDPAVAEVICLTFDDALPEFYPVVRDFLAFVRPGDARGAWAIADGVPLIGAGWR